MIECVYVVSVPVLVQVWAVQNNVLKRALSLVAEGAGVCVTEVYSVCVGWQYGVVSTTESSQVYSIYT